MTAKDSKASKAYKWKEDILLRSISIIKPRVIFIKPRVIWHKDADKLWDNIGREELFKLEENMLHAERLKREYEEACNRVYVVLAGAIIRPHTPAKTKSER